MTSLSESDPAVGNDSPVSPAAQKPSSAGKMSMALINFWLDAALLVSMIFMMCVSAMLHLVFPPPTEAAGWTLWGLSYDDWHRAQFFSVCVLALLAVEHLVLHWNWVCTVIATHVLHVKKRPDEGVQAVYGVGIFIAILILVMGTLLIAMVMARHVPSR